METEATTPASTPAPATAAPAATSARRLDRLHIVLIVLLTLVVGAAAGIWWVRAYVFPSELTPVRLSEKEERVLTSKLDRLESLQTGRRSGAAPAGEPGSAAGEALPPLEPEPYTEAGARREVVLSEKEVNALLARNTDLARRLAIDLSGNLLSARLLVPLDPDFPILGGETLKVRAGVELAYRQGKPVVVLKGISVMGVPLPNAWIGGIKNIDLVQEFGGQEGFWKSFADGVEDIHVEEGRLLIKLKE
jgi:hypothetical protein